MIEKHYLLPDRWVQKWPALQKIFWALEAFILRLAMWFMRLFSMQRGYDLAVGLCRLVEPFTPFTDKFERNLLIAFPEISRPEIRKIAVDTCANIGKALADLVLAKRIWKEREERIEFVTLGETNPPFEPGRPVVLVTAHIGAWQLASFVVARHKMSMVSVYAPEANPFLHKLVNNLRADLHSGFVPKKGCMRELMSTLKRGDVVGFVPDLRMDGGAQLPLFDVNTPSNTTAARLALHHGCELVPVHAERLPGCRFKITTYPPIRADDQNASVEEQARQMTQKQLALFETWIRDTPDQWLCVGRRWEEHVYDRRPNALNVSSHLDFANK